MLRKRKKLFAEKMKEQGRQEMLAQVMRKFEAMHDDYYSQGDLKATNLAIDMVAFLQDDYEAISDESF